MSNESQNDKSKRCAAIIQWCNRQCKHTARYGDFCKKHCPKDSISTANSSKIPVVNERDSALVHSAIGCLEPIADRDWDGKWRIKKALAFLSQVGDTLACEPVSIAEIASRLYQSTQHDFEDLKAIVKTAYGAAGVKYVNTYEDCKAVESAEQQDECVEGEKIHFLVQEMLKACEGLEDLEDCMREALVAIRPHLQSRQPVLSKHYMADGRPIFGEGSPHNIREHLEKLGVEQPVGRSDDKYSIALELVNFLEPFGISVGMGYMVDAVNHVGLTKRESQQTAESSYRIDRDDDGREILTLHAIGDKDEDEKWVRYDIYESLCKQERESIEEGLRAELAAHRAVFDAARELGRLMDEVEQDDAGQNDRVFAHFEFDQLRYALGLVANLKGCATNQIEVGDSHE